jgi:hypothetical protein
MKKTLFWVVIVLISVTPSSCLLFKIYEDIYVFEHRNDERDIQGNVIIYVQNRTKEIIVVFNKERGYSLAQISYGDMQLINIKMGESIYVIGGNTNTQYLETVCDEDQKRYVIY